MKRMLVRLLPDVAREALLQVRAMQEWAGRAYSAPSPPHVKRAVLARYSSPDTTWVETGTFLGDTSDYLSRRARKVITIEPSPDLVKRARARFEKRPEITVIEGLSEKVLPEIVKDLVGPTCFWLDGHYSAGITYKGPQITPIAQELACIERHLAHLAPLTVLVDDIRLFGRGTASGGYPPLELLVSWATRNTLDWSIEHDIFVARASTSEGSA